LGPRIMSHFRRVEDRVAGPTALGILVPPGRQTFVILRPRALPWDLLLLRDATSTGFREIFRDEAPRAVDAIYRALVGPDSEDRIDRYIRVMAGWLRVTIRGFHFVVCRREPGEAYQPHVFANAAELERAMKDLMAVFCSTTDTVQEIYFNTRHFEK